jgi:hypothetical protein
MTSYIFQNFVFIKIFRQNLFDVFVNFFHTIYSCLTLNVVHSHSRLCGLNFILITLCVSDPGSIGLVDFALCIDGCKTFEVSRIATLLSCACRIFLQ